MTARVVLALVLVGILATPSAAAVVCRKKGLVVVREECKKREKIVPLGDLPNGPPGDQGAAAPTPVRIVDVAGRQLGLFAEPGNEDNATIVVFDVGGQLVFYLVGRPAIVGGDDSFYHQVADCSDQPVLVQNPNDFVRRGAVIGPTAYFAGDPIETKRLLAREYTSAGCGSGTPLPNGRCCAAVLPQDVQVGPATTAFELSEFTPPFRLEP